MATEAGSLRPGLRRLTPSSRAATRSSLRSCCSPLACWPSASYCRLLPFGASKPFGEARAAGLGSPSASANHTIPTATIPMGRTGSGRQTHHMLMTKVARNTTVGPSLVGHRLDIP